MHDHSDSNLTFMDSKYHRIHKKRASYWWNLDKRNTYNICFGSREGDLCFLKRPLPVTDADSWAEKLSNVSKCRLLARWHPVKRQMSALTYSNCPGSCWNPHLPWDYHPLPFSCPGALKPINLKCCDPYQGLCIAPDAHPAACASTDTGNVQ